jgi:hypothetical protein
MTLEPGDPTDPGLAFLPPTMMIDLSLPDRAETLGAGDPTDPGLAFLPLTMMIDLSLPDRVADCASTIFEADCLGLVDG